MLHKGHKALINFKRQHCTLGTSELQAIQLQVIYIFQHKTIRLQFNCYVSSYNDF